MGERDAVARPTSDATYAVSWPQTGLVFAAYAAAEPTAADDDRARRRSPASDASSAAGRAPRAPSRRWHASVEEQSGDHPDSAAELVLPMAD